MTSDLRATKTGAPIGSVGIKARPQGQPGDDTLKPGLLAVLRFRFGFPYRALARSVHGRGPQLNGRLLASLRKRHLAHGLDRQARNV